MRFRGDEYDRVFQIHVDQQLVNRDVKRATCILQMPKLVVVFAVRCVAMGSPSRCSAQRSVQARCSLYSHGPQDNRPKA